MLPPSLRIPVTAHILVLVVVVVGGVGVGVGVASVVGGDAKRGVNNIMIVAIIIISLIIIELPKPVGLSQNCYDLFNEVLEDGDRLSDEGLAVV